MRLKLNNTRLNKALKLLKDYSKEKSFTEAKEERNERVTFFQDIVKGELSEIDFELLIKKLWAMRIWGNKDYVVEKMLQENGLNEMRKILKDTYNSDESPGTLYENLVSKIKYMGPSMATELLCHLKPHKAGIWNNKARDSLKWLGISNIPYNKYRISGKEYNTFNETLKSIAEILAKEGFEDIDLLFVDYLLWEITERIDIVPTIQDKDQPKELSIKSASRHDELKEKVAQIGSWLGFQYDMETKISKGAIVDAIWIARIANLGKVTYVFEVQDRGSIDSLILNLQRALTNASVQKLVVVTDEKQIEKIKNEVESMPENFRRALTYWEDLEVDRTHEHLEYVNSSIQRLNLVPEAL